MLTYFVNSSAQKLARLAQQFKENFQQEFNEHNERIKGEIEAEGQTHSNKLDRLNRYTTRPVISNRQLPRS